VESVKPSRGDKAAATRRRIVEAAYESFCEVGFRGTTMAGIAERAGVAVQTVYFTFHTKDELLQAVHDQTVLGPDQVPPPQRDWYRAAVAERDPAAAIAHVVRGVGAILARVAPLLPVWPSVAGEPAGELFQRSEDLRRREMRNLAVTVLLPKGKRRPGLTIDQAGDVLTVLLGPPTYRTYVLELGWSPKTWATWTTDTLTRALFAKD